MAELASPYFSFDLRGNMLFINSIRSATVDNMKAVIDGDELIINDNQIELCRGVLADYTGLVGASLIAKVQNLGDRYSGAKPIRGGTSTKTEVVATLSNVRLVADNPDRIRATIRNPGPNIIYADESPTATIATAGWSIPAGLQLVIDDSTVEINGIWDVAGGNAQVTVITP